MKVHRIMRSNIIQIAPDTSVRAAAALMEMLDIGILPICENGRPIGVVTDRDIVVRLMTKTGAATDVPISQIMSNPVITCHAEDEIEKIAWIMGDHQVRRLLVLDDDGRVVGVLSVCDIARDLDEKIAGEVLGEIVEFR